jgi:hypothetical protein
MGFWFVALAVVSILSMVIISSSLQPKIQKRGPGELQAPVCEQGYPIAYIAGCAKIRGANVVWKGKTEVADYKSQTFYYFCRMQLAICHGKVDRIRRVWFAQDNVPNAKISYTSGGSSPIQNVMNIESATSYNHPPYWEGTRSFSVGEGGRPYLGSIVIVGTSPSGWIYSPAPGSFAIYSQKFALMSVDDRFYWQIVAPVIGDTIMRDGAYCRWDGSAWIVTAFSPDLAGAKQIIDLNISDKVKGLSVDGRMIWYDGSDNQTPNGTLSKHQRNNGTTPGYSGLCYVVLTGKDFDPSGNSIYPNKGFYWGESPSIPEISFEVERIPNPLELPETIPTTGISNVANAASVRSYNTPPYPSPGGKYPPRHAVGTVIVVGNSPANSTYWGSSAAGKQGWFARYISPVGTYCEWEFIEPNNNDTVVLDGLFAQWNGQGWVRGDSAWAPCIDGGLETARDANPANVLYELLTSPTFGLGVSNVDVDIASFRDAGKIMHHEGIGITLVIDQQMSFDDAAKEINTVADGMLFEDPSTGLWTYRLIREPISVPTATELGLETTFYTRTDWPIFDDNDFSGDPEYTRGSWGDVANQIKVQFIDRDEGYAQRVVDVQDLGNYMSQNEIVTVQNTYNAVTRRSTAIRLAYRDLRTAGVPRARLKDRLNRRGWLLRPGDCFVVNRPSLGISNMRFRVTNIRYGTMQNMGIEIEAIEDVFGMPSTVYQEQGSGWVDPSTVLPLAPSEIRAWELAYDVTRDGPRVGFAALVARADTDTMGAVLWQLVGGSLQEIGPIAYTPTGLLTSGLAFEERTSTIQLQALMDMDGIASIGSINAGENLLLVDDEVIAFSSIGWNPDGTVYLSGCWRGVLDTIPASHAQGSRAWIIRRPPPVTPAISIADREELFTIQATASGGKTNPIGQEVVGGTTQSRELRPFVPGRFRVESDDLATTITDRIIAGDVDVAWEKRNRLTQAPGVVAQDEPSVEPEANQESRLVVREGLGLTLDPYIPDGGGLEGLSGNLWPFGTPVRVPGAAAYGWVSWLDFKDNQSFYRPIGIGNMPFFPWALPNFGVTFYVGIQHTTMGWSYDYSGTDDTIVYLYSVLCQVSGADMIYAMTDLRGAITDTELVNSTSATSHAVTPQDIVDLEATGPINLTLDSVRDGLTSWEQRESGLVFPVGWGMGWGTVWGGTINSVVPPIPDSGWGFDWGNNWGGE